MGITVHIRLMHRQIISNKMKKKRMYILMMMMTLTKKMKISIKNTMTFNLLECTQSKKKKKKRKHRHYNDYEQNRAFSISDNNNILNGHQSMNGDQPPHRKKQKIMNNNSEAIKCRKCNKIFTLEVDLLLHKTNDHC